MSWPIDIAVMSQGRQLEVRYDDGIISKISAELLRVESPSAEVQGHSAAQKIIVTGKQNVAIIKVEPIGNYAIKLVFDDGHNTGIYTWEYLRKLGEDAGR